MTAVTFPTTLGGDGSTVTDDSNPTTGLAAGGHRTRFVPALAGAVDMAQSAFDSAARAAMRNVLINGSFEVWNETTGSVSSASNAWRAEGWYITASGAAVTSLRSTTVRTNARARYSIEIVGAASVTTVQLGQRIESLDIQKIKGTVTFQAWVYNGSGASFTPNLLIYTAGSVDAWGSPTVRLTQALQACPNAQWTQVSHTVDISGYTNLANGVTLELQLPSGSMVSGDTNRVMEPMLCFGSSVTDFALEPIQVTERRCERFFEKSFLPGTAPAQNVGVNTGESVFRAIQAGALSDGSPQIRFRTTKRATPSMTLYNPAAANAQVRDESSNTDTTATATGRISVHGFDVSCTGNASTVISGVLGIHWTANARLS